MTRHPAQQITSYRAIEGALELQFCNDDGEIEATKTEQVEFLQAEGFTDHDIDYYMAHFEWDDEGHCIGEA